MTPNSSSTRTPLSDRRASQPSPSSPARILAHDGADGGQHDAHLHAGEDRRQGAGQLDGPEALAPPGLEDGGQVAMAELGPLQPGDGARW